MLWKAHSVHLKLLVFISNTGDFRCPTESLSLAVLLLSFQSDSEEQLLVSLILLNDLPVVPSL